MKNKADNTGTADIYARNPYVEEIQWMKDPTTNIPIFISCCI